jgi:hypothetical protein
VKSPFAYRASAILTALSLSTLAFGAEPDFYIDFSSCHNVVGFLRLVKEPLLIDKGDPVLNTCHRRGDRISCRMHFEGGQQGHKGNTGEYLVTLDSPPLLHFQLMQGNEYIAVNTAEHAAVMSSLVLAESVVGSKVCHGTFITASEFKKLRETKKGRR